MPHIPAPAPGRLANLSAPIAPELRVSGQRPATAASTPVPLRPPTPSAPSRKFNSGTLSLFKHEVDPMRVLTHLYGPDLETDEHSGVTRRSGRPGGGSFAG